MNTAWIKWDALKDILRGRKVYCFGRSEDWIPKCIPHVQIKGIIDSNWSFWGTRYLGIEVISPDDFYHQYERDSCYILITNSDYENVGSVLVSRGLEPGKDFCFCPEFYDFWALDKLRRTEAQIILSSPDYQSGKASRVSRFGGGLFLLAIENEQVDIVKIQDGQFRQIEVRGDRLLAVEYNQGCLIEYLIERLPRLRLKELRRLELPRAHFCGLAVDDDLVAVANSSTDLIHLYTRDFEPLKIIPLGKKAGEAGISAHHINDLAFLNNKELAVSYFSKSGFWKNDIFDGGVSVVPVDGNSEADEILSGLWQPHSPALFDGKLAVLDSMNGSLLYGGKRLVTLPGFVRGIRKAGGLFWIGQSETMYTSRRVNTFDHTMNNAGVWLFDHQNKSSRFFPCFGICNIHDLHVIS